MNINELIQYTDTLLEIKKFKDYCPNGLQVEGKKNIQKIALAVTASYAIIEQSIQMQSDCLIVHHGFFWKNDPPIVTNHRKKRLHAILSANLNLAAYHLPLDFHHDIGNNIALAQYLEIKDTEFKNTQDIPMLLGNIQPTSLESFCAQITDKLARKPIAVSGGNHPIARIALCTGAGQNFIEEAKILGADTYISGEISEQTTHLARENNIHYIGAGHHATERYGIQKLGEMIEKQFKIKCIFIDEYNPA